MQDRTSATSAKSSCNARPDHTYGSIATDEVEVTRSRMSASPLKADNLHTISANPLSAITGCEQSQQVALLLEHFVASRKIAASSAFLMHGMPHQ